MGIRNMNPWRLACLGVGALGLAAALSAPASAEIVYFSDMSGLAAEAEFTLLSPTQLRIRLKNTSTDLPDGASGSDQILSAISWDFGNPGPHFMDPMITGGSVVIGPNSETVGFSTGWYGPGTDVSGEWGFSNSNNTGLMQNYVTSGQPQATPFGGQNLHGTQELAGPSGGLISSAAGLPPMGVGEGAIRDEVIITLTLSQGIADLGFLYDYGARIEFGSDYYWIEGQVPAPAGFALLALAGLASRRRRRA